MEREEAEGVVLDVVTGYPVKVEEGFEPIERPGEIVFWIMLDQELIGARNDNGFLIPSEVEAALDRWNIKHPDNREAAREMLWQIAAGRNEGAAESDSDRKTKKGTSRGGERGKPLRAGS